MTGLMTLSYGQREFKISVDIIHWKKMEFSGWISMISAMNLMKFTFVETINNLKLGITSLSKVLGKDNMPKAYQLQTIEMPNLKRIHNMVLQLTNLVKVLLFSDAVKKIVEIQPACLNCITM